MEQGSNFLLFLQESIDLVILNYVSSIIKIELAHLRGAVLEKLRLKSPLFKEGI